MITGKFRRAVFVNLSINPMIFKEKYWWRLFEAGITIKAINGAWQTIVGLGLLVVPRNLLKKTFLAMLRRELLEDPGDKFIRFLNIQSQHWFVVAKDFTGFLILVHGIVNLFLAYNLHRKRLWAYKVALVFVSLFLIYLLHRFGHSHSPWLLGIIIFDLCFITLTWHEYNYRKHLKSDS